MFLRGPFAGVPVTDAFAQSAMREEPVVVGIPQVDWPQGLAPVERPFGAYTQGVKITDALTERTDVLILLYTDHEVMALLDVFTQDNAWDEARKRTWYPYSYNFDHFSSSILFKNSDLTAGIFGYLKAFTIGGRRVTLFASALHPKVNGPDLAFVPVVQQLVTELAPSLVITTGTAGAIGAALNCGDVAISAAARFHVRTTYSRYPGINTMSASKAQVSNSVALDTTYLDYAAANFTQLSLPGLQTCYDRIAGRPGYAFLARNTAPPRIFTTTLKPAPGPQPMDVVTADYLTVDDTNNSEGLQPLGIVNDTDDAFVSYAILQLPAPIQPKWLSVRNVSEPQIQAAPFPNGTPQDQIVRTLSGVAGAIYGVYQYCTTLNSAFACWGVVAGYR
jgi:hypothetical protein